MIGQLEPAGLKPERPGCARFQGDEKLQFRLTAQMGLSFHLFLDRSHQPLIFECGYQPF